MEVYVLIPLVALEDPYVFETEDDAHRYATARWGGGWRLSARIAWHSVIDGKMTDQMIAEQQDGR